MEENEIELNLNDYTPYIENVTAEEKRTIQSVVKQYDFRYGDIITINTTSEDFFSFLVYVMRSHRPAPKPHSYSKFRNT